MASARYRCLLPVRELAAMAIRCSVLGDLGRADPAATARDLGQRRVDVVVAGKLLGPAIVEVARLVVDDGAPLVADFCDDWFDHPKFGPLNLALAALADRLVVSTPALAQALERHVGRRATIISDPYEGPRGVARFGPGRDRLELLWFGNENNYPTIAPVLSQLLALSSRRPLRLTIVTRLDGIARLPAPSSPSFLLDHVAWTLDVLWRHLATCDAVIIPSLATSYHAAKSANRLVEAIRAGRAVAAHCVSSYGDFAVFCWLGDDIAGSIAAMIADPGTVERRIAAGQAFIARRHAPAIIAAQWFDALQGA